MSPARCQSAWLSLSPVRYSPAACTHKRLITTHYHYQEPHKTFHYCYFTPLVGGSCFAHSATCSTTSPSGLSKPSPKNIPDPSRMAPKQRSSPKDYTAQTLQQSSVHFRMRTDSCQGLEHNRPASPKSCFPSRRDGLLLHPQLQISNRHGSWPSN